MPTMKRLAADQLAAAGRVDRARLRTTTEEEIARQIAADPETAPDLADAEGWRVVRRPPVPDVRQLRARLGLSQAAFARRFGLSARTVQEWEHGRSVPDGPARVLLRVIEDAPEAVERAVRAS